MKHHLDPLLRPASVAIVGASARADSMGGWSLQNLERGGFTGAIYPVNPGHAEIRGMRCYQSLSEISTRPDLVIFAVADRHLEALLDEAITLGVPAAVIMSSLCLDDDSAPVLKVRVQEKIRQSGMLVCGANGMGFYNFHDHTWACGFDSRQHPAAGNISLISHSGSGMCGIIDCDERLQLNFAVSTGNELAVAMDQYLDFALDLAGTKVVGLFIETARNPAAFREALKKANRLKIPVVALKVGRTKKAAELAVSHSGAMAGDDDTYAALFARYGVHRVADMDELATALILFAALDPLGPGGLVTLHDSGGERQLMVDLADDANVPLTSLSAETTAKLTAVLDPELPALNPLDGWSRGGESAEEQMTQCLSLLMQDSAAAVGALLLDRAPDGKIYESYVRRMEKGVAASGKPAVLVSARQGTGSDPLVVASTRRGFPVVDGVTPFLRGIRGLMNYRDFQAQPEIVATVVSPQVVATWENYLANKTVIDEACAMSLLNDFGIASSAGHVLSDKEALLVAARKLTYPLVLKTASDGIQHKTEQRGVILDISDQQQLLDAYQDLHDRLGPKVLLAAMAPPGVEMILGAKYDPQFGPVIMLGFGGILAEVIRDVVFALPPFDARTARQMLDKLKGRALLDGVRGAPPAAIIRFCEMAAKFSAMVNALDKQIKEIDINPVIVSDKTCIAVDALIICRKSGDQE